jgi:hypothetical protein
MKLPKYSAEASLGPSSIAYTGAVGHGGSNRGAIVPAVDCSDVNCDSAQALCILSLDLDPISCGLYYGCCQGAGRTGGDPSSNPSANIPVSSNLPLTSVDPTLSASFSDIRRQLNRIQRCACGNPAITTVVRSPFVPSSVVAPRVPPPYYLG